MSDLNRRSTRTSVPTQKRLSDLIDTSTQRLIEAFNYEANPSDAKTLLHKYTLLKQAYSQYRENSLVAESRLKDLPSCYGDLVAQKRARHTYMFEVEGELRDINLQLDALGTPARSSLGFPADSVIEDDLSITSEPNGAAAGDNFSDAAEEPPVQATGRIPDSDVPSCLPAAPSAPVGSVSPTVDNLYLKYSFPSTLAPAATLPPYSFSIPACNRVAITTSSPAPPIRSDARCALPAAADLVRSPTGASNLSELSTYMARSELMKEPPESDKFSGAKEHFLDWWHDLEARMRLVDLSGRDKLRVLKLNTKGKAHTIVETYAKSRTDVNVEEGFKKAIEALRERYGPSGTVTDALNRIISPVKRLSSGEDPEELGALVDLIEHIRCVLATFNTSENELGKHLCIKLLVDLAQKLNSDLMKEWRHELSRFCESNPTVDPKLDVFATFILKAYRRSKNPFLSRLNNPKPDKAHRALATRPEPPVQSDVKAEKPKTKPKDPCFLHPNGEHRISECTTFARFDGPKRKDMLKERKRCYRCGYKHLVRDCHVRVSCTTCNSRGHATFLHGIPGKDNVSSANTTPIPTSVATGTDAVSTAASPTYSASATFMAASCNTDVLDFEEIEFSKTLLVNVRQKECPKHVVVCNAMVDIQARQTFATNDLVEALDTGSTAHEYNLETVAGFSTYIKGGRVSGLQVQSARGGPWYDLPPVLLGSHVPDSRAERATRDVVECLPNLQYLAHLFEPEMPDVATMLLIGSNARKLMRSNSVSSVPPYAHKTPLGWALVGHVPRSVVPEHCLSRSVRPSTDRVLRTGVKEHTNFFATPALLPRHERWSKTADIFETRADDESETWSQDEETFVCIMKDGMRIMPDGSIQLPLPLRTSVASLPSNETPVYYRTKSVLDRIARDKAMLGDCQAALQKSLDLGHVEMVPPSEVTPLFLAHWLPIFPVKHPRKEGVRLVFDVSAKYKNTSLNDLLYTGPQADLNTPLRSVLNGFRLRPVAISLDIKHMFHCFGVPPEQRDLLRFHWWQDNDPSKPIVQYRGKVHFFGARSSPGVAMFALKAIAHMGRQTGELSESEAQLLENAFYMDDGMSSFYLAQDAVVAVSRLKPYLAKFGLHIHKINSNDPEVLETLVIDNEPSGTVVIEPDQVPRALGVTWDIRSDTLSTVFQVPERPFTHRGLLASSLTTFDPLGIGAPVALGPKLTLRRALAASPSDERGWDDPLPCQFKPEWTAWKKDVAETPSLSVKRCIFPFLQSSCKEIHVFADASLDAISSVAYARSVDEVTGCVDVTFISAQSRLAPKAAVTVPRLELGAALLASQHAKSIQADLSIESLCLYSDSRIVLGYLRNKSKTFVRYVTRRIEAILVEFDESCWHFVPTDCNPADIATRPVSPSQLLQSSWLTGPTFLKESTVTNFEIDVATDLPETVVTTRACAISSQENFFCPLTTLAERVSSWFRLVLIVKFVFRFVLKVDRVRRRLGEQMPVRKDTLSFQQAELLLFRAAQIDSFSFLFDAEGKARTRSLSSIPERHCLAGLVPIVDGNNLLRVGGRLRNTVSSFESKHPIILHGLSAITKLFVTFVHCLSHQGRMLTLNAVRQRGVFVIGGRRLVEQVVKNCDTCVRLRGTASPQLMADLPEARVLESAPFDHVGLDVFGPFFVHDGKKTRRTSGSKKVFVLLITCLASRAVHVEALAGMDTSSLRNALERFFSLRGDCKSVRSDRGSNFVGLLNQGGEFQRLCDDLETRGVTWDLSPVSASHYNGAVERKIGSVRRVMEAFLFKSQGSASLSRDEFCTLLQAAARVVNSTPLYKAPYGPDEPLAVSPAHLLTLKSPFSYERPSSSERDLMSYGPRRWLRAQHLANEFWRLWRDHYLHELVARRKWTRPRPNLQKGDVVLVRDKAAPRGDWRLALVLDPIPGKDGLVRRACVRMMDARGAMRETERAVTDLVLLHAQAAGGGMCSQGLQSQV